MQSACRSQARNSQGRNAEPRITRKLSKNARRKFKRYRFPGLVRQKAVDEQLQSMPLCRNEGRRGIQTILNGMVDQIHVARG